MNAQNTKITLAIFACVVIAIGNQVWADTDEQAKAATKTTVPMEVASSQKTSIPKEDVELLSAPNSETSLELEKKKVVEAEKEALKEGSLLKHSHPDEVVIGPPHNENWPKSQQK